MSTASLVSSPAVVVAVSGELASLPLKGEPPTERPRKGLVTTLSTFEANCLTRDGDATGAERAADLATLEAAAAGGADAALRRDPSLAVALLGRWLRVLAASMVKKYLRVCSAGDYVGEYDGHCVDMF